MHSGLFDRPLSLSLHLFEHIHGDDRKCRLTFDQK